MSETWTVAFGLYLRSLRERRGLSLNNVESLSQTFADDVQKGYLSRVENGRQRLAFSKVIALSRIYEVPADVLLERMELDLELDRVGCPPTEGLTFAELTTRGAEALHKGYLWPAYGLLREAVLRSTTDGVKKSFRDRDEQQATARMNCGTAARSLGRHQYALFEFLAIDIAMLGPRLQPIIAERIATTYLSLKRHELAIRYADDAIRRAEEGGIDYALGYAYSTRGLIASLQKDFALSADLYRKAYDAYKNDERSLECIRSLNNLSQCYFYLKRYKAARRTGEVAARLAKESDYPRFWALSQILLGELDELDQQSERAMRRWKDANEVAKTLNDKVLRFKAEFVQFRHAKTNGNGPVTRAIQRRLTKLAPWIPEDTDELESFREMSIAE